MLLSSYFRSYISFLIFISTFRSYFSFLLPFLLPFAFIDVGLEANGLKGQREGCGCGWLVLTPLPSTHTYLSACLPAGAPQPQLPRRTPTDKHTWQETHGTPPPLLGAYPFERSTTGDWAPPLLSFQLYAWDARVHGTDVGGCIECVGAWYDDDCVSIKA